MPELKDPLRVMYAESFFLYFSDSFDALLVGAPAEFIITAHEMHDWLAGSGYATYFVRGEEMSFSEVPERGTPEWSKFSEIFTKVRAELNSAAQYGAHGDPAYRVDALRPNFVVRNMASQAIVTGSNMAKGLRSLADNNQRRMTQQHEFLADHLDELPPALQHQIGQHNRMFSAMVRRVTADFNEYLLFTGDDFEQARAVLGLPAPEEAA